MNICWTSLFAYVIVNALFASEFLLIAGESEKTRATAKVKLADPETENKLAAMKSELEALRKDLATSEAERKRLKDDLDFSSKENSILRRELLETLDKYSMQAERLKRLEMSTAGTIEKLEPVYAGAREVELADSLRLMIQTGSRLAAKTAVFSNDLSGTLQALPMDKVEAAKLRIKLDDIRKESQEMARLCAPPTPPEGFEKCRILEVNSDLKAVVLSAGSRNGARVGMILKSGKDGKTVMQVTAVRPFVSAAIIVEGESKDLGIGMEALAASVSTQRKN